MWDGGMKEMKSDEGTKDRKEINGTNGRKWDKGKEGIILDLKMKEVGNGVREERGDGNKWDG